MPNDPRPEPLSPDEIESMMRRTTFAMAVEGYWFGLCVCGNETGVSLLEPTRDDRYYILCPACKRSGKDGSVQWVRREP